MSSDVPHPNSRGGTALTDIYIYIYTLTGNANCVKNTKKTEIDHVTMNIEEACGIIWTYSLEPW